ncbi:hypothetical protein QAD02_020933 [Eretmocerus hayati]|uniref:Uncharacterized protein n=1 Tax=Eretmocerus hayati TaxID=131215 RepID=A0ACC2PTM4_9HYME|nr:hypothetical protein QAD02_020933 [Eretmocerus hayati]
MDLQPCGSTKAIAFHICAYVPKSERSRVTAAISEAIQLIMREDTDIKHKLFKACMKIFHEQQVSAPESAFRLCHLPLRHSSRKCIFLNTRKPELRYRVVKFDDRGEHSGFCTNIFDRYEKRPTHHEDFDFDGMCLLEFAIRFEPLFKNVNDEDLLDVDFDDDLDTGRRKRQIKLLEDKQMLIRTREAVVRVSYFTETENAEDYFYSMLVQYLPFRSGNELLFGYESAKDALLVREEKKAMNEYMQLFRERDQQLENAFNQIHALENPSQLSRCS